MLVSSSRTLSLLALISLPGALALPGPRWKRQQEDAQTSFTLDPTVIQPGLVDDGQNPPVPGQVPSLTSTNNFINFCLTQNVPITDGKQIEGGSCNPAPMGRIPSVEKIPSCKFVFPKNGDTSIVENTAFQVKLAMRNLATGFFGNAKANYYANPQTLNDDGIIKGHSHVVIELLSGGFTQTQITNPSAFAFFKGVNTVAVDGILTVDVTNGLPAGSYRMATINGALTHQPVLAPIAQHGSMDDHTYFTVVPANAAPPPPEPNNGDNNDDNAGDAPESPPVSPPPADNGAPAPSPPPSEPINGDNNDGNAGDAPESPPVSPPPADNGASAPPPSVQNENLQPSAETPGDAPETTQQGDQVVSGDAQPNDDA